MIALIDLIDDEPKQEEINLFSMAENIINRIWAILRKNWAPHKYYIHQFKSKQTLNTHQLAFSFTSIHHEFFRIITLVQIQLSFQIKIKIQSHIGSQLKQILKALPELQKSIMELRTMKKASLNLFDFTVDFNGIKTTEHLIYSINLAPRQFSKILFEKLNYSVILCQKVIRQLKTTIDYQCSDLLNLEEKKSVEIYSKLSLGEKQNQRFKEYYKGQRNGQSLLKNPKFIEKRKHQSVRSFRFNSNSPVHQVSLSNQDKQRYKGGNSEVFYIKHGAWVQNTIINFRNQRFQNPNLEKKFHNEFYVQKFAIIKKVPSKNPKLRKNAQLSTINQNYFLTNILSTQSSPFMCNYYFNVDIKQDPLQPIYSDFHRQNTSDIFFGKLPFTMLDLLNFTEQLVIALITQYLRKGFLHRDIKTGNILLSRGVIQIIDNGSIYIYYTPEKNQLIQRHKKHLDSALRTTYRIPQKEIDKSQRLMKKHVTPFNFQRQNNQHRTFDVYSVGKMLEEILSRYEIQEIPKWMEVSVAWYNLISVMIQKDFQIRIQMEKVLEEIQNIRSKIFGKDQNPQQ